MCTPPPYSAGGGGGEFESSTKSKSGRGGLTGSQFLEGNCWERGV